MSNSIVEPQNSGFIKEEGIEFFEQLIILGNGFDLACGLKSSYSDFFNYIFKNNYKNNYWYRVFEYSNGGESNTNNTWTDIESRILMELQNLEFLFRINLLKNIKEEIENDKSIDADLDKIKLKYDNNIHTLVKEAARVTDLDKKIRYHLETNLEYEYLDGDSVIGTASILIIYAFDFISSIEEVHKLLKDELFSLESDFKKFLKQQIELAIEEFDLAFNSDSQTDYKQLKQYFWTSRYLIWILINDSLPAETQFDYYFDNSGDCLTVPPSFERFWRTHGNFSTLVQDLHENYMIHNSILSFNYTNPFQDSARIRNIHGDLDSDNLIFGIDYDKLNSHFDTPPIKFSKSYRILENDTTSSFNITPRIEVIKFYGHGLGAADYAYFQSIFDTVDLYHGTTKLIFFWSTYKRADKDFLYKEQVKKVVNLIEEYGSTFTNQNHGRNLLTKLQLENRLIIKEIKSI